MTEYVKKIRITFDELAYLLALIGVQEYPFFAMRERNISPDLAVRLVNSMQKKKWIRTDGNRYLLDPEIRRMLDSFAGLRIAFHLQAPYNRCPDLMCTIDETGQITASELDQGRHETVSIATYTVPDFCRMLEDDGYLKGVIEVTDEENGLAENVMTTDFPTSGKILVMTALSDYHPVYSGIILYLQGTFPFLSVISQQEEMAAGSAYTKERLIRLLEEWGVDAE